MWQQCGLRYYGNVGKLSEAGPDEHAAAQGCSSPGWALAKARKRDSQGFARIAESNPETESAFGSRFDNKVTAGLAAFSMKSESA